MERAVEERIARPLSLRILSGEVTPGGTIRIDIDAGELRFEVLPGSATAAAGPPAPSPAPMAPPAEDEVTAGLRPDPRPSGSFETPEGKGA